LANLLEVDDDVDDDDEEDDEDDEDDAGLGQDCGAPAGAAAAPAAATTLETAFEATETEVVRGVCGFCFLSSSIIILRLTFLLEVVREVAAAADMTIYCENTHAKQTHANKHTRTYAKRTQKRTRIVKATHMNEMNENV
jgi:hypothetical protein